jgi:hypothetical protein
MEIYRAVPVAESVGIILRVSSAHSHEREREHNGHQEDLSSREPKLCFAVDSDSQNVE